MIADRISERPEAPAIVGSYVCRSCGTNLSFEGGDRLTRCPTCGGTSFRRNRLFEPLRHDEAQTIESSTAGGGGEPPTWLGDARRRLPRSGPHLASRRGDGGTEVVPLEVGWSRIGRSARADIRLDDPTVSRRHALLIRTREGEVRVLDDRSLNGVRLNGERVEWSPLADGDELAIGRFRFYLLEREPTGSATVEPSPSAD